ncbi:aspartyl-phosphate phosphatase Spo0E family protein [Paenibacillus sp. S150]|uniref:aspartyl-phosphate phosphatase Spo0E family protein n=1 Tax=Paenibacillus sp. S150 TaxID=2749826 RepID=UPI001C575508|nr:aspartyl-phosphate phosphatase Spo0E family protein [Paenibacillus sp. S150]MBW4081057.1 aspartyl-phosphate phosphatase Spo0E family protein [Paenibacillus sp. S150]
MGNEEQKARIERERKALNTLAVELGMRHPRVLSQSVKLDALINEYIDSQKDEEDEFVPRDK